MVRFGSFQSCQYLARGKPAVLPLYRAAAAAAKSARALTDGATGPSPGSAVDTFVQAQGGAARMSTMGVSPCAVIRLSVASSCFQSYAGSAGSRGDAGRVCAMVAHEACT